MLILCQGFSSASFLACLSSILPSSSEIYTYLDSGLVADNISLYTLKFILLLLSVVILSIHTREQVFCQQYMSTPEDMPIPFSSHHSGLTVHRMLSQKCMGIFRWDFFFDKLKSGLLVLELITDLCLVPRS